LIITTQGYHTTKMNTICLWYNHAMNEHLERARTFDDSQDLTLARKIREYGNIYTFVFKPEKKIEFKPGYYAHVLVHDLGDEAGKPVRYLSIASSPNDSEVQFSTHVRKKSLFKQKLGSLAEGEVVTIYKVKGVFILPTEIDRPVVLIAGGIGITPFRSMMLDEKQKNSKRDLTLIHISDEEYLYEKDLKNLHFAQYRIKRDNIEKTVADVYKEKPNALFYVSGPIGFVADLSKLLTSIGVEGKSIKIDEFTGYL